MHGDVELLTALTCVSVALANVFAQNLLNIHLRCQEARLTKSRKARKRLAKFAVQLPGAVMNKSVRVEVAEAWPDWRM